MRVRYSSIRIGRVGLLGLVTRFNLCSVRVNVVKLFIVLTLIRAHHTSGPVSVLLGRYGYSIAKSNRCHPMLGGVSRRHGSNTLLVRAAEWIEGSHDIINVVGGEGVIAPGVCVC